MAELLWIANASPVILLAKIGLADLLLEMPAQLIIPAGVDAEIRDGATDDCAVRWLPGPATGCVLLCSRSTRRLPHGTWAEAKAKSSRARFSARGAKW